MIFGLFKKKKDKVSVPVTQKRKKSKSRNKHKMSELLKLATQKAKSKDLEGAIQALRDAYEIDQKEKSLPLSAYCRLPMYLQKAGNNDEGFNELSKLLVYGTPIEGRPSNSSGWLWVQSDIHRKMADYLANEKKFEEAVLMVIDSIIDKLRSIQVEIDEIEKDPNFVFVDVSVEYDEMDDETQELLLSTNLSNANFQLLNLKKRPGNVIRYDTGKESHLMKIMKKGKLVDEFDPVVSIIKNYLEEFPTVDIASLHSSVEKHLLSRK